MEASPIPPVSPPSANEGPVDHPPPRFLQAAANLLHKSSDRDVPYVVVHRAPCAGLPKEFTASTYHGLLFCHLVRSGSDCRLFSYWQSRQFFEIYGADFQSTLTTGPETLVDGSITHSARKQERWWSRFPFWTVVITASALIGAFAALWQSGAQLFERPDITVTFSSKNPVNLLNTDAQSLAFSVTNQCRFASAQVRIRAALAPSGKPPQELAFPNEDTARLSKIEPGKHEDFDLRGSSTPVPVAGGGPQLYQWTLRVVSDAGLLRGERAFTFQSPVMAVWKPVDWTRPKLERQTPGECRFAGSLYSGIDQNVRGTIRVAAPVAIRSLLTVVDGAPYTQYDSSPSLKVASQEIELPGLKAFRPRPYDYEVVIRGDDFDEAACRSALDRLNVKFSQSTGGRS